MANERKAVVGRVAELAALGKRLADSGVAVSVLPTTDLFTAGRHQELTELADKVVRVQLERSTGVGEVRLVGGQERAIDINRRLGLLETPREGDPDIGMA